jgi:hypothetical protein
MGNRHIQRITIKRLIIVLTLIAELGAYDALVKNVPHCDKDTQKVVMQKDGSLDLEDMEAKVCMISVEQLHPTQFAVGMEAVQCKKQKLESKDQDNKLEKYLARKQLGPLGAWIEQFLLFDGSPSYRCSASKRRVKEHEKRIIGLSPGRFLEQQELSRVLRTYGGAPLRVAGG